MKIFKTTRIIVPIIVMGLLLTACGSQSTTTPDKSTAQPPAEKTAKGKKVVSSLLGLGFEFMVGLNDSSKSIAQNEGMNIQVLDAKTDPNLQASQMQDIIAMRPDAIFLSPVVGSLITPSVEAANKAGIPVFGVESKPSGGDEVAFVGFDNYKGGQVAADTLGKLVGGKGTVLESRGMIGAYSADLRNKGFNDQMKKAFPDIKVITLKSDWNADTAFTKTIDSFSADPNIVGVFSHNDEMVRGIVSALEKLGKQKPLGQPGHVAVVGLDGTALALDRIRQGTEDATINSDPFEMGKVAMQRVAQYFRGESFPKETLQFSVVVTKENVDDPNLWGNNKMFKK